MMTATKAEVMTEVGKLASLSEHRALDQYTKALPTMEVFTKAINDLRSKFFHLEELVKTKYQRIIEVDQLMKAQYQKVQTEFLTKAEHASHNELMEQRIQNELELKTDRIDRQLSENRIF
jgi:hypothetical protein